MAGGGSPEAEIRNRRLSAELLVNVTPRETRVAVIENGMLQETFIERANRRGLVGNIYKGRVCRVLPGMQAAFVDIGLERAAFLHASDIIGASEDPADDGTPDPADTQHIARPDTQQLIAEQPPRVIKSIAELVRDGQEVLVQVIKDPLGTKGARLTTHISIPSCYLVYMPNSGSIGVSQRIEDETERDRLRVIGGLTPPGGLTITGTLRRTPPGIPYQIWNSMLALNHDGMPVATFDKSHLVPFGEYVPFRNLLTLAKVTSGAVDFSPGEGVQTLRLPGLPPVSPLICYEVIFPGKVVDPEDRPQWMLNITNDAWYGKSSGPYQHLATARLRAVEEGLPLVRVANTGISAIVDPWGRILARIGLGEQGIIDGPLPAPLATQPAYARFGNWMVLLVVAVAISTGLLLSRRE